MSDSEDDLIAYGTPLEPLEEDEIPNKKPRLLEDQTVTDKQGRRRFHGAFTGGFSAGFFNTVGSLEGWAPSSFKSSKSKKQEILQQKPEDFMDEEDISEFGIAPVVLKARRDYTVEGKREASAFSQFLPLGTYVIQDVLRHVRETIGIKLLKKMGWKQGQGVGPRLNINEKKKFLKMRQKTYGCQLPPGTADEKENDSNSDSEWDDVEFAPSDYEPFLCEARVNFCGLGYEGLDKRPILSGNFHVEEEVKTKRANKFGFSSQAFGVGAFEEEDDDIYAKDDMSHYNFFLGKDESADVNKTEKASSASDGAIDGFVLQKKVLSKKIYPLPVIPKDVKPHHRVRRSRFDQPPPINKENVVKIMKTNYEDRRNLLDGPSETVVYAKKQEEAKKLISNVSIQESKFKPFANNSEKQERYENYLKLTKLGRKELLSDLQPYSMTNWDKEREKVEFEKASLLFKPLTGGMEDRFSTASQPDDLSDPLAVVEKYCDENDDRKKAAKMKMFGPITRRTEDWIPNSVLCKRFNIPQPSTENRQSQSSGKEKRNAYFNLFDSLQNPKENVEEAVKPEESQKPQPSTLRTQERTSEEEEPETVETKEENITDLYKAIFLASDDEEESREEENEKGQSTDEPNADISKETSGEDILYEDKLINLKRNSSPPKGIFENIDLDLLSGRDRKEISVQEKSPEKKTEAMEEANILPVDLVYGPQIPEKITVKTGSFTGEAFQDGGVWVEKKSRSEKKHKKKDKKSKKASHKSKHKHKHKR